MTTNQSPETARSAQLFNEYGHFIGSFKNEHDHYVNCIPRECVADCSAAGSVDRAVAYWRRKLDFQVPRERAIDYLAATGAWPRESNKYDAGLNEMSDDALAEKVLWLACGDMKERGEWLGLCQ